MTREELNNMMMMVTLLAVGYAIYVHQKLAKGSDTGDVPPRNTGIVPPGYDPQTHDYTASHDALLRGVMPGDWGTAAEVS